jgi:ABC-type sugar transport system substrate-binding protein
MSWSPYHGTLRFTDRITVITFVTLVAETDKLSSSRARMKKLNLVLSLTNKDNDYQLEQAAAGEEAAKRLGVDLQILDAENDAIGQSQQLLKLIQSHSETPSGIIFEPAGGTAMPQVARAAAIAGIGWVVLNREVDYIHELRQNHHIPAFVVTSNHEEVGRIQGQQVAALLPNGGSILYIQGPSENLAAKQRATGMYETKPAEVEVKLMRAQWTEASAYRTVSSWLRLSTSLQTRIDVIAAQDDSMALGARKAFEELPAGKARERWLSLPFLGCDGLPNSGQAWVRKGLLTATIYIPANAGKAVDMLVQALRSGSIPPEQTLTVPVSIPAIESLSLSGGKRTLSAGTA